MSEPWYNCKLEQARVDGKQERMGLYGLGESAGMFTCPLRTAARVWVTAIASATAIPIIQSAVNVPFSPRKECGRC